MDWLRWLTFLRTHGECMICTETFMGGARIGMENTTAKAWPIRRGQLKARTASCAAGTTAAVPVLAGRYVAFTKSRRNVGPDTDFGLWLLKAHDCNLFRLQRLHWWKRNDSPSAVTERSALPLLERSRSMPGGESGSLCQRHDINARRWLHPEAIVVGYDLQHFGVS